MASFRVCDKMGFVAVGCSVGMGDPTKSSLGSCNMMGSLTVGCGAGLGCSIKAGLGHCDILKSVTIEHGGDFSGTLIKTSFRDCDMIFVAMRCSGDLGAPIIANSRAHNKSGPLTWVCGKGQTCSWLARVYGVMGSFIKKGSPGAIW